MRSVTKRVGPSARSEARVSSVSKSVADIATRSAARLLSADQTIELVPSASGKNASVPLRMKRCQAVFSCERSVATVATIAVSLKSDTLAVSPTASRTADLAPSAPITSFADSVPALEELETLHKALSRGIAATER